MNQTQDLKKIRHDLSLVLATYRTAIPELLAGKKDARIQSMLEQSEKRLSEVVSFLDLKEQERLTRTGDL